MFLLQPFEQDKTTGQVISNRIWNFPFAIDATHARSLLVVKHWTHFTPSLFVDELPKSLHVRNRFQSHPFVLSIFRHDFTFWPFNTTNHAIWFTWKLTISYDFIEDFCMCVNKPRNKSPQQRALYIPIPLKYFPFSIPKSERKKLYFSSRLSSHHSRTKKLNLILLLSWKLLLRFFFTSVSRKRINENILLGNVMNSILTF